MLLIPLLLVITPIFAAPHDIPGACEMNLIHPLLAYESVTVESMEPTFSAPHVSRRDFLASITPLGLNSNPLVMAALNQADVSHATMHRADGSSYLTQHVYPVALSALREWYYNPVVRAAVSGPEIILAAALLHDVLEDDGSLTDEIVAVRLGVQGHEVVPIVRALTKPEIKIEGFEKLRAKWFKNYFYVSRLGRSSVAAIAIKLADRMNNITSTLALLHSHGVLDGKSDICPSNLGLRNHCSPYDELAPHTQTAVFYVIETQDFYAALAQRVSYHYYLRLQFMLDRIRAEISTALPWSEAEAETRRRIRGEPPVGTRSSSV